MERNQKEYLVVDVFLNNLKTTISSPNWMIYDVSEFYPPCYSLLHFSGLRPSYEITVKNFTHVGPVKEVHLDFDLQIRYRFTIDELRKLVKEVYDNLSMDEYYEYEVKRIEDLTECTAVQLWDEYVYYRGELYSEKIFDYEYDNIEVKDVNKFEFALYYSDLRYRNSKIIFTDLIKE